MILTFMGTRGDIECIPRYWCRIARRYKQQVVAVAHRATHSMNVRRFA
jgi:hypothetical protein